jgi:hypothetical protein
LSPPQSVKYSLIEADHIAAAHYTNSHSPAVAAFHRRMRRRTLLAGCVMVATSSVLHLTAPDFPPFPKAMLLIGGSALVLLGALHPLRIRRAVRARTRSFIRQGIVPLSDDETRLTIDEKGIAVEQPHLATMIAWPKITHVRATPEHLFLYWQPVTPLTVPARGFVSEEGFTGFCRLAERLWEEHRAG